MDDSKKFYHLELRRKPLGLQHYLEGNPVCNDDLIEVFTGAKDVKLGRYVWDGLENSAAAVIFDEESGVAIWDDTLCRWPR